MPNILPGTDPKRKAVEEIFSAHPKAQFVVMKPAPAKSPAWRGWNRKRPGAGIVIDALAAGNGIALVPATVETAVIDIDAGDPALLQKARPPLCMLKTRRGAHAFYGAGTHPPANKIKRVIELPGGEITADVICGATPHTRRYVVIHSAGALVTLAEALSSGTPPPPFPHDLLAFLPPAAKRYNDDPRRIQKHLSQPRRIDLSNIYPGARNNNLFSVCCRWSQAGVAMHRAGLIKTPDDLLHAAVLWNDEMPVPLSLAEVESIARKAWKYLPLVSGGKGLPFYTHDSQSQRRRQGIMTANRNAARRDQVEAGYALAGEGKSEREIARKTGVPKATIHRWLKPPGIA